MNNSTQKLFFVALGGNVISTNIEMHDVRWVVGENIEDTYKQLRNEWFGRPKGLHIDSYMQVKFIDGYAISLKKFVCNKTRENTKKSEPVMRLWFVNFGGYIMSSLHEQHCCTLIVAENANKAKKLARDRFVNDLQHKHIDDCKLINRCQGLEVILNKDHQGRSQRMKPDWFGYRKIDS